MRLTEATAGSTVISGTARTADPLILTGIQDITAWVDFTAVAEAAVESGMTVGGYTSQAEFLLHGGLRIGRLEHRPDVGAATC